MQDQIVSNISLSTLSAAALYKEDRGDGLNNVNDWTKTAAECTGGAEGNCLRFAPGEGVHDTKGNIPKLTIQYI